MRRKNLKLKCGDLAWPGDPQRRPMLINNIFDKTYVEEKRLPWNQVVILLEDETDSDWLLVHAGTFGVKYVIANGIVKY